MFDLPLLGASVAIIGIIISYITQKSQNEQSEKDNKRLNSVITDKTDEISRLTKEIANFQTGGNSYCYLNFFVMPGSDVVEIRLIHVGKYPLSKLTICLLDASTVKRGDNDYGIPTHPDKYIRSFNLESLEVGTKAVIENYAFKKQDEILFCVGFKARNTKWAQRIILKRNIRDGYPEGAKELYTYSSEVYKLEESQDIQGGNFSGYKKNVLLKPQSPGHLPTINPVEWDRINFHFDCDGFIQNGFSIRNSIIN